MRFCPKCGKKGIKGDFCRDCYEVESGLEFNDIEAIKCVECEKYLVGNKWKSYPDDNTGIVETALTKIKNPRRIPMTIEPHYFVIHNKPGIKNEIELHITVEEDQEFNIPGFVFVKACPKCSKKGTQYFEGILQLRDMTPEIENFVAMDLAAATHLGVHVAKELRKNKYWDVWVTDKRYLRRLGKKLQKKFTGQLTESATLHTRDKQSSKDLFRLNVMFKPRTFKIGDIIQQKEKRIKVTTVAKRISGIDVDTGKKVFID